MAANPLTETQARRVAAAALTAPDAELCMVAGAEGWLAYVPVAAGVVLGNATVYVDVRGSVHDVPSNVPDVAEMERLLAVSEGFREKTRRSSM